MFEEVRVRKRERVKAAETACKNNETDPKAWRQWAMNLLELSCVMTGENYGADEILDAITKLEKCLELKPDDPDEVKWKIGQTNVHLLIANRLTMPSLDEYEKYCNRALELFNEKPEYRKSCREPELAQMGLEDLRFFSAPKSASQWKDLEESEVAKQACIENSGDAKNWKNWVMSLVRLRGIVEDEDLDKNMLSDAKNKLEAAVKEDKKDLELMWSLGEVYMLIVTADPSIRCFKHLYQEYCEKSIHCFNAVQIVENDYHKGSIGLLMARQGRRM